VTFLGQIVFTAHLCSNDRTYCMLRRSPSYIRRGAKSDWLIFRHSSRERLTKRKLLGCLF